MRGACGGGWYHLRQCPSRRAQLCLAYLSKHTSAQAWRRAAVQPVLDSAWIERVLPLGTWISPHHFRNLLVSQARRRRLEKRERVQNREGSESSLRVSYWSSNNGSTGKATHSIVLLRQHTVLLSPTADRHRQRDGRRASMARSAFAKNEPTTKPFPYPERHNSEG